MKKYLFTFFSLLLVSASVAALVPSEQALEAASPYRRSGEEATVVNRPYVVDSRSYWIVYFHPQTTPEAKNAVIAIDAETGEVVTNEATLRKVYTLDFKLTFLQDFLVEKKLSFSDMKSTLDAGKTKRDQAQVTLDSLQESLEREGKEITSVQNAFSIFVVAVERFNDNLDGGASSEEVFNREYSSIALEALLSSYSTTFFSMLGFLRSGSDYQSAVINKSNELTQQGVDSNKFRPQLQSAYEVGLDIFPSLSAFQSALTEFNSINSTQNQRLVNDSMQSFLYRKGKADSDSAVESVRQRVEEVLSQKAEINECTGTGQMERAWNNALASQERGSFGAVQGNVTLVQAELDRIKREFDICNGVTSTPSNTPQSDNSNFYIAGIIVLLVAYVGYTYYKKRKAAEEDGGSGGGSLFRP